MARASDLALAISALALPTAPPPQRLAARPRHEVVAALDDLTRSLPGPVSTCTPAEEDVARRLLAAAQAAADRLAGLQARVLSHPPEVLALDYRYVLIETRDEARLLARDLLLAGADPDRRPALAGDLAAATVDPLTALADTAA
jgi:hypothetical protein